VSTTTDAASRATAATIDEIAEVLAPQTSATLGAAGSSIDAVQSLVGEASRSAESVPLLISGTRVELSQQISRQAGLRSQVASQIGAQSSTASSSAAASFSAAESIRNAIRSAIAADRAATLARGTDLVQAATSAEVSRAALDAPELSTAIQSASSAASWQLSSSLVAEDSRATQNCTAQIALSNTAGTPASQSGRDFASWFDSADSIMS
jgi:hypothetical protein